MNKRFLILAVLLISALIMISGCGNSKKMDEDGDDDLVSNSVNCISLGTSVEGADDSQSYWNIFNNNFARGENGYYYLDSESNHIMYFDAKTQKTKLLCNKEGCNHDTSSCDSYIGICQESSIWYYKGYLYILKYTETNLMLERVNTDGSVKEDLFEVGGAYDKKHIYNLVFNDDCVYIYDRFGDYMTATEASIRKRSLDGKQDEIIFSQTGKNIMVEAAKSYGDKLFFIVENVPNEDKQSVAQSLGLYEYDYNTKQVKNILDKNICDYTIDVEDELIYYYVMDDGLYEWDIASDKTTKIYDGAGNTSCKVSNDGNYLYMNFVQDKMTYMLVMNLEGQQLNKIETGTANTNSYTNNNTFFGDEQYMFFSSGVGAKTQFKYIEKTDGATETKLMPLGN